MNATLRSSRSYASSTSSESAQPLCSECRSGPTRDALPDLRGKTGHRSASKTCRRARLVLACSRVWPEFYLARAVGKEQRRLSRLYPSPLIGCPGEATQCAPTLTKPSLYDRLGGIYAIASVVDDFIDRIMIDPALNANPLVDDAHHRVGKAGFKYLVTEMVGWATGGPQNRHRPFDARLARGPGDH